MTNTNYIKRILNYVERILVDTSTLMTPSFQQFVVNNKKLFISNGKKMIVHKSVYAELARHLLSTDVSKCQSVFSAINLLVSNNDIFQVESVPLTEYEIAHAFADPHLLSELTLHRSSCNQLLVTNDRRLSCDAFNLNQQQSCKGFKVLVCYINHFGELQCCECARPCTDSFTSESANNTVENTTIHIAKKQPHEVENNWEFDWKSGLISISSIGILYGLYKSSKSLIQYI